MREKIKHFFTHEESRSKVLFGSFMAIALTAVFAPGLVNAIFGQRLYGPVGCGYGWGYAYGQSYEVVYGCYFGGGDDGAVVPPDAIGNLFASGLGQVFGGDPTNSPQLTFISDVILQITVPGLPSGLTITFPANTTLTAGSNVDWSQLTSGVGTVTGLPTGQTEVASFQFGFPSLGLTVNPPVTVSFPVSGINDGRGLNIYRTPAGSTTPAFFGTCVVTNGTCSFEVSEFSTYTATTGSASSGTGGGGGGGGGAYTPNQDQGVTGSEPQIFGYGTDGEEIKVGALIKTPGIPAVYYVDEAGVRHVFVNERVYRSWYGQDFSKVFNVSLDTIAKLRLGAPVTYHPGRMIKIQTDPKVYLTVGNRGLAHVSSEAVAADLFGADWNQHIDDVDVAFFFTYVFDHDPVMARADVNLIALQSSSHTINNELRGKTTIAGN